MTNTAGSVYFRGAERFDVYGVKDYAPTYYALCGDWLVPVGAAFFALAAILRVRKRYR